MSDKQPEAPTCATCKSIGVAYWDNGFTVSHQCMKEATRRAEGMPRGADFFAHFRAFFDASANQKACRHYEERAIASPDVLSLLERLAPTGRAELKFMSDESVTVNRVSGKFVKEVRHATAPSGYRVFKLLEVGRREHDRAALAKSEAQS